MIYVTGDTHGEFDRFRDSQVKKLKKDDILMICGDFGFIWTGEKSEQRILKKIGKRRYDTVFVEGCHDNYDLLQDYPIVPYRGGQARKISGNLYQLLRGEVYEMCGKKVFAFGGGDSEEEITSGSLWWKEEQPSEQEQQHAVENLKRCGGKVDYIITHDAPLLIKHFIRIDDTESSCIHEFLDYIARNCDFKQWYFGRYHLDKVIPPRYFAAFQKIYKTE